MRYYQDYAKTPDIQQKISVPKPKLNVGIFNEFMGQFPQIQYLIKDRSNEISYSEEFEQESEDRKKTGKRDIPKFETLKYLGEGVSW